MNHWKNLMAVAAFFAGTAVVLGALGAHALENKLSADALDSFKTAVRYQMWHALAIIFLALLAKNYPVKKLIAWLWVIGIVFFSGSIYLLSTRSLTGWPVNWLGPVTPLGGLLLIVGWFWLAISLSRKSAN